MPFFSIVIPTYNRAHIIEETIQSVLNQTYSDWECLVIDDGSRDSTVQVVDEITRKDNRIKYIYQANAERSAARNNGIKNAKGNYICFLDSDDTFEKNHLQFLFDNIVDSKQPKMYFVDYNLITSKEKERIFSEKLNEDTIHYLCYNPIIPARVCIHKEIVDKIIFDEDIVVVEDLILWLKIAMLYPIVQLNEATINYHMHDDNSVNIKNTGYQKRLSGLLKFKKRNPEIWKTIVKKDRDFLLGNTHFGIAKHYIFHSKKIRAIFHIIMSLFYQKKHKQLKHKLYLLKQILVGNHIEEYSK